MIDITTLTSGDILRCTNYEDEESAIVRDECVYEIVSVHETFVTIYDDDDEEEEINLNNFMLIAKKIEENIIPIKKTPMKKIGNIGKIDIVEYEGSIILTDNDGDCLSMSKECFNELKQKTI